MRRWLIEASSIAGPPIKALAKLMCTEEGGYLFGFRVVGEGHAATIPKTLHPKL